MEKKITMETEYTDTVSLEDIDGGKIDLELSYSVAELYNMYQAIEDLQKQFRTKKQIAKKGVDTYIDEALKILLRNEYSKIEGKRYTVQSKIKLAQTIIKDILTPRIKRFNRELVPKYAKQFKT